MNYPTRLLPKKEYKILEKVQELAPHHLIRGSELPLDEFIDPVTGRPRATAIEKFTKNVKDLSTSLVGTFMPEDVSIKIIGNRKAYLVFDPWPEGEEIQTPPSFEEFEIIHTPTTYYFSIERVDGCSFAFSTSDGSKPEAKLEVKHTPCRSNFWHFSIRVYDEKNKDIFDNFIEKPNRKLNSKERAILTTARNIIKELAILSPPDLVPADDAIFTKERA